MSEAIQIVQPNDDEDINELSVSVQELRIGAMLAYEEMITATQHYEEDSFPNPVARIG
jgi:hypothetical protein